MFLQEIAQEYEPSKTEQILGLISAIAHYLSLRGLPLYFAYTLVFWVGITLILIGVVIIEGFIRFFRWVVIVGWVIIAVALAVMIQFVIS